MQITNQEGEEEEKEKGKKVKGIKTFTQISCSQKTCRSFDEFMNRYLTASMVL